MVNKRTYYIWPITDNANESFAEEFGGLSSDVCEIKVRGKSLKVYRTENNLMVDRVMKSETHRNHLHIYVQEPGEEEIKLCYPRRRGHKLPKFG